jgi:hypothetical protein
MNKLIIAMTAVSTLAMAAPAAAQWNNPANANVNAGGTVGIDNRIARLEARIQAGVQNGSIDRTEARNLRMQLRQLQRLERQYSMNGLSQQERADLQTRVRTFRDQLRLADGGGNGYGYGNAGAGYGNNGNQGYGNQGYGNQGYGNNGYGAGGPYDECIDDSRNDSGGIGGIFDAIFGGGATTNRNTNCTGLNVGQRVSGNLGAVPYQYRNQYRDGNGVYYRSDGRNVYQIDARTNTVVRVYGMNR